MPTEYKPPVHHSPDGTTAPLVGQSAYAQDLTIVGGVLTIPGAGIYTVHPETGTSDDLDTITSSCLRGERVTLKAAQAVTIVVRHATGNIRITGVGKIILGYSYGPDAGPPPDMLHCELVLHDKAWWAVGAGSTRAVLAESRVFTETRGAGTYTAVFLLSANATVLGIILKNQVLWGATTAVLNVGDADDADGYLAGIDLTIEPSADINGAGGLSTLPAAGKPGSYSLTNVTPDRGFDADSTSLDEIADVVGTLIGDVGGGAGGAYAGSSKYSSSDQVITATVVTTGGGGDTGRSRVTVVYLLGGETDAVKA